MYHKGKESFNGILFVEYPSPAARETAMKKFNCKGCQFSDARSWMNPDLPIEVRAPKSFLLNLKKLLVSWDFSKTSIEFDDVTHVLSVEGSPILKACGLGNSFRIEWLNKEWEQWGELTGNAEFQTLVKTATDRLAEAGKRKQKGKWRGNGQA